MEFAVGFDDLANSDLIMGAIYKGGTQGTVADDPIGKLVPVGNQGGFRYKGSPIKESVRIAVVYTSGAEEEWPDHLDDKTGILTYYGDNRSPGQDLLGTRRKGNLLLKKVFAAIAATPADRANVPPFLFLEKVGTGRDVRFRGLLAPGATNHSADEALKAVWKESADGPYENYESLFTVLNADPVRRVWIDAVVEGVPPIEAPNCPTAWRSWVEGLEYDVLPKYAVGS
ncbi:hypothetical protein H7I77_21940 [Mycolicibacterium novocastrense]|uniref:Restriction endonuclease AspBHI N-terminal domain-containing protein n=1 Tax=Mycolicibacterium novocastrense TaxID=59813 RepID=A0AAW5SS69_MYCNV|nr:hypothetical protein [Mycolicibacterium novocastrense]MCV7025978.1 hypothetical protein [Mycolicibacterium novocastrense]GAT08460.1 uncharacterized protein RMCN_1593 [Mycolicibacterium novocastrense]